MAGVNLTWVQWKRNEVDIARETGGSWREALFVVADAVGWKPAPEVYDAALQACVQVGHWWTALELLDDMASDDILPDVTSYGHVIRAYSNGITARDWEMPLSMWSHMQNTTAELIGEMLAAVEEQDGWDGLDTETYNAAIQACSDAAQLGQAMELFYQMRNAGLQPDGASYRAMIGACRQGRDWTMTLSMLEEMKALAMSPGVAAYREAIIACNDAREANVAVELLQESREMGIPPDPVTYDAAISACEQMQSWEWMASLLGESVQSLRAYRSRDDNELPDDNQAKADTEGFVAAITSCGRCKEWELALQLLEEAKVPDTSWAGSAVFNAAVRACTHSGEASRVIPLIAEMLELRLSPDLFAYHSAMLEHVRLDEWEVSARYYDHVRKAGLCSTWILNHHTLNVSSLEPDVAALCLQILLEETCRKPRNPIRPLEIFTSGFDVTPDDDGFDSDMKRFLYPLVSEELGLKADPYNVGSIVVPKRQMTMLRRQLRGELKDDGLVHKKKVPELAQDFAWSSADDE